MARKAWRDSYVAAHISNTISSQITKLRNANGWTQTQLADQVGMKQSRISALEDPNWENVEVATLRRLAAAFNVGLTVRFTPFSDLARWAATLSEDKLLVPSYEQEAVEEIERPAMHGAAAAFITSLNQQVVPRGLVDHAAENACRPILPPLFSDEESSRKDIIHPQDIAAAALAATRSIEQLSQVAP